MKDKLKAWLITLFVAIVFVFLFIEIVLPLLIIFVLISVAGILISLIYEP